MKKPFTNLIGACCSLLFLFIFSAQIANAQYCSSASTNTTFEWLSNVEFAGIDNPSGSTTYSDFTAISGDVIPGVSYEFTGTISQTGSDPETIVVYIDWDQSLSFEPSERTQIGTSCSGNCSLTGMIDVPANAVPGATRMRVIQQYFSAATSPCGLFTYGEVEDYTINVQSGVCTPPSFTFTTTNNCEADTYSVNGLLNSYGTNGFVTVVRTRSDAVPMTNLTLVAPNGPPVGNNIPFFQNIPFGVTVTAEIQSQNPICNLTKNFAQLICPVENDECADALPLPCNSSYYGTNQGATVDTARCALFGSNGPGVWFSYSPTAQTIVTLSTCDPLTTFDTDLTVFTGSCEDLTCFTGFSGDGYTDGSPEGCNLAGLTFSAGGTFTAYAGETYYILLSGYFTDDIGEYNLTVTCEELTCTSPDLALSVVDINGDPIVGCLPAGASYYVNASLSNGTGNANYNVVVNGGTAVSIPAGGSGILGPVATGTAANVVATGADEASCNASGSAASPEVCAALNDLPCDAISIPTDGSLVSGTNIGATADTNEVVPPQGACNGTMSWCDGPVVNNSIWFTFVGPASGRVRIDGCNPGSSFDSQFAIYTADDCNDYSTFELIGANDDRPAPLFPSCSFGSFRSGIELCVEEGITYYLQVDGYFGATGIAGITIDEIDAAACNCVPPVVPPGFIFASTEAYCAVDTVGYTVTFYSPEDLGSSEFFIYTYNIDGGNSGVENVAAGDSITLNEIIPLGTLINITISLSDTSCAGGVAPGFPLSGSIAQNTAACDPDCEGVPGGNADPGTPCDADGAPGVYNADCECIASPANDLPCNALSLECGSSVTGSTTSASQSGLVNPTCAGGSLVDVFYTLDAVPGTEYTVTVNGADYDGVLVLYSGECDGELTELDCSDNGFTDGVAETIVFSVETAQSVLIRTYDWSSTGGTYTLDVTCVSDNDVTLNGTVTWNSNCGDRDGTVRLYTPNTATLIETYNITVAANGTFTIEDLPVGTYDVIVKVQGYLAKGIQDVVIATGDNSLAVGAIKNGNINNDGAINIFDVSLINAAFNTSVGNPNYNPLADLNCDGNINIFDISILNASFNQSGATAPLGN